MLTRATSRLYNDISYTLNDDEEDVAEGEEAKVNPDIKKEKKEKKDTENKINSSGKNIVLKSRLREINFENKNDDERRVH